MKANYSKYILDFIRPGGTSRGVLHQKETYFLCLRKGSAWGIGECALFRGLSSDDVPDYEQKLQWVCENIQMGEEILYESLKGYPSIVFGLEQAFLSLRATDPMQLFETDFLKGAPIDINGLIWMGDIGFMEEQVSSKLAEGFRCLKFKIGALDFKEEIKLLSGLRERFGPDQLEIRVDANGAFKPTEALERLKTLAALDIHSIEQPIRQGQVEEMRELCSSSPLPIALDEELIGIWDKEQKEHLLRQIQPDYIILKPSLLGGFRASGEWIETAEKSGVGWWITSALESNIGLNAIAQWTAGLSTSLPQGLGTGSLFSNNFKSPLVVQNAKLWYAPNKSWAETEIRNICI